MRTVSIQQRWVRFLAVLAVLLCLVILPRTGVAFPDDEVLGASDANPPFDFGLGATVQNFLLFTDQRLAVSYGETLKLIDTGLYALETDQPPALSADDETDGVLAGLGYDSGRNQLVASQEDGDILFFLLSDITATPVSVTLAEDKKLGPVVIDAANGEAYVANNGDGSVHVVNLLTQEITRTVTVTIPAVSNYTITDAVWVVDMTEAYFTTDAGVVFYIAKDGTSATIIDITTGETLTAIDVGPNGTFLYVTNDTSGTDTDEVVRISTSTHAVTATISFLVDSVVTNSDPTDVVITSVVNPTATYAYVSGAGIAGTNGGVSVINTNDDELLDMGVDPDQDGEPIEMTTEPLLLQASSSTDGNVYVSDSNQDVGLISASPLVVISSLTYSSGGTTLGQHESFTIVFSFSSPDAVDGTSYTYEVRANGSVDASGTLLVDDSGASSGTTPAETDTTVTFNYDGNSAAFEEGTNDIFVFVTVGDNRGRRATTLTVDTPPPNVTMRSTGFGTNRVYVNFDRIDVADMSHYNIYADTDAAAVMTKSDVSGTTAQGTASTLTGEATGLTNGATYYIAMEAVDLNGNKSEARTNTFADGSVATGVPEQTVGPAQLLGEKGCGLLPKGSRYPLPLWPLMAFAFLLMARLARRRGNGFLFGVIPECLNRGSRLKTAGSDRRKRGFLGVFILVCIILVPLLAQAQGVQERDIAAIDRGYTESRQLGSFEMKTGFWLPQNNVVKGFFGNCCNLITRLQGGLLFQKRYGVELGVGFFYKSATAVGMTSGRTAQQKFNLILIPIETSFVWRADYFTWRYLIPYLKTGIDYVYFRQGLSGGSVQGMKYGLHGTGGVMLNVGEIAGVSVELDNDWGVNDLFVTFEAEYRWINNFGGGGLDLSGQLYSVGILFEF